MEHWLCPKYIGSLTPFLVFIEMIIWRRWKHHQRMLFYRWVVLSRLMMYTYIARMWLVGSPSTSSVYWYIRTISFMALGLPVSNPIEKYHMNLSPTWNGSHVKRKCSITGCSFRWMADQKLLNEIHSLIALAYREGSLGHMENPISFRKERKTSNPLKQRTWS